MSGQLDQRIRQLVGEVVEAAPVPHPWVELRGRARGRVRGDRTRVVVGVAAACVVLAVVGLTVLATRDEPGRIVRTEQPAAPPTDTASTSTSMSAPLSEEAVTLARAAPAGADNVYLADIAALREALATAIPADRVDDEVLMRALPALPLQLPDSMLAAVVGVGDITAAARWGPSGLTSEDGPELGAALTVNLPHQEIADRLIDAGYREISEGRYATDRSPMEEYATVVQLDGQRLVLGQFESHVDAALVRLAGGATLPSDIAQGLDLVDGPVRAILRHAALPNVDADLTECDPLTVRGDRVDGSGTYALRARGEWATADFASPEAAPDALAVLLAACETVAPRGTSG